MTNLPILIVGAGPAGLTCATTLAQAGHEVVVFERKKTIGQKVCAGGITINGQLSVIPQTLLQKTFYEQTVVTPFQNINLTSNSPMLATVDRVELGQAMLEKATLAGVKVISNCSVIKITSKCLCYKESGSNSVTEKPYRILIGADGASSIVRRFLKLPVEYFGVGIHCQIPGSKDKMEWHFSPSYFENGYGWIFPHKGSYSVGAYVDSAMMSPSKLNKNFKKWAQSIGINLNEQPLKSERISYDFKGFEFGNIYLVGEAAGITSAITGEGINAAIISGNHIASLILGDNSYEKEMKRLLKRHSEHIKLLSFTKNSSILKKILPEMVVLSLRLKLLNFSKLELTS